MICRLCENNILYEGTEPNFCAFCRPNKINYDRNCMLCDIATVNEYCCDSCWDNYNLSHEVRGLSDERILQYIKALRSTL